MFPAPALVSFNRHGGEVIPGFELLMSQSNGTPGTIYYTLDGSDPRLTAISPGVGTSTIFVSENAAKRVLVPIRAISDNWKGGERFNDSAWSACLGSPGGLGYERSSGYADLITFDLEAQMYRKNATCYIRIPFAFRCQLGRLRLYDAEGALR